MTDKKYYKPRATLSDEEITELRKRKREYYQENRDKVRATHAAWHKAKYARDPDYRKQKNKWQKEYRERYPERVRAQKQNYRKSNPVEIKVSKILGISMAEARRQLHGEKHDQAAS